MSLLDGITGTASEVNIRELYKEFAEVLGDDEKIETAYKLVRDLYVFTTRRLILVDKQGLTGKRTEYFSIPYRSVISFSIETAGHFDIDSKLKIWLAGRAEPIEKTFNDHLDIFEIQRVLANYIS